MDKTPTCCAPFSQILLQANGNMSPCCYHMGYKVGSIQSGAVLDAWNSPKMQKLRQEHLEGHHKICHKQMQHQNCQRHFEHLRTEIDPALTQTKPPIRLDLRLNGQCNLSCIMCDVWQQPNGLYNDSDLWSRGPKEIFPFLKEVDLLGGEPFMQKDTYRLIDAVRQVNDHCTFAFVTNGHYPLTKSYKNLLSDLPLRYIQISIDSLNKETYRTIRGGDLNLVLETLAYIGALSESRGFELRLSLCVLQNNVGEIPEFLKLCYRWQATADLQYAYYDPSGKASLNHQNPDEMRQTLGFLRTIDHPQIAKIKAPLEAALSR